MLDVPHTVHEEGCAADDLTELTDDQLVAQKIEVIQNVLFEIPHIGFVVIISIILDKDVGMRNEIFQKQVCFTYCIADAGNRTGKILSRTPILKSSFLRTETYLVGRRDENT